jgi:hypothetical protein
VGKPEGKRPIGRPRRRWEDGIRLDLKGLARRMLSGLNWLRIEVCGGAVVNAVMNLGVLAPRI